MPKYRAFIHGANFHIYSHDSARVETLGFYTNAFLEARDARTAEFEALELIHHSPKLQGVIRNPADDPPRICVEELEEIADWPEDTARPLTGLALYDEAAEAGAE